MVYSIPQNDGFVNEMIGGILAGWETVLGIERDVTYVEIGRKRIAWWTGSKPETILPPQEEPPKTPEAPQGQLSLF
jgi:hypothetical protein